MGTKGAPQQAPCRIKRKTDCIERGGSLISAGAVLLPVRRTQGILTQTSRILCGSGCRVFEMNGSAVKSHPLKPRWRFAFFAATSKEGRRRGGETTFYRHFLVPARAIRTPAPSSAPSGHLPPKGKVCATNSNSSYPHHCALSIKIPEEGTTFLRNRFDNGINPAWRR